MAHYAFIDDNNIVTEVITGKDENELLDELTPEEWYANFRGQRCIRTSYNNNIRKNFAGVGFFYNETLDAFIPPKPYSKWILDEEICKWKPPIEYPLDEKDYKWNDNKGEWKSYF